MAGIRDSKTANGITYHYDTLNGKVVRQTWTQNGKEKVFDIIYDAGGQPYACVYEGYRYYYVLNQQGDVIQIVGSEGTVCAEYRYDAWGNVLSITGLYAGTLGAVNPIRYRGYFYDTETGFYYLQSRYYDPSIGRFINADSFTSTGQGFLGCNMFAYCNNNPPRYTDSAGFSVKDCFLENIKDGKTPIGGGGGGGVILKIAGTGLWEAFLSFIFGENEEDIGESAVTGAVSGMSDSGLVPKEITVPLLAIYTFYDNLSEGDTPVTGDKVCKALYKTATTVFLGEISLTDDEFNRMSLYIFQAGEDLGIGGIERLAHNFIDNITIEVYKPNYTAPAFGAVGGGARNSYYAFN